MHSSRHPSRSTPQLHVRHSSCSRSRAGHQPLVYARAAFNVSSSHSRIQRRAEVFHSRALSCCQLSWQSPVGPVRSGIDPKSPFSFRVARRPAAVQRGSRQAGGYSHLVRLSPMDVSHDCPRKERNSTGECGAVRCSAVFPQLRYNDIGAVSGGC